MPQAFGLLRSSPASIRLVRSKQLLHFTVVHEDYEARVVWIERDAVVDVDPIAVLTAYLRSGRTESARRLAEKAVVLIDPHALRGEIVWPH